MTGIEATPSLIRAGLKALIEREAARRLIVLGPGLEHQCSPPTHELHRVFQGQRTNGVIGRELAKRMSGRTAHEWREFFMNDRPHGSPVGQQRWLRVVCEREFVGGTIECDPAQLFAKRFIGPIPHITRRGP